MTTELSEKQQNEILNQKMVSVPTSEILNYGTLDRYSEEEIRNAIAQRFRYRAWSPEQVARGKEVTEAFIEAAFAVIENVPPCPTRTRVLNEIEITRMLANAAITHEGSF